MKILMISSVYPSKYDPIGTTPVVHYFVREWVRQGHQIQVIHTKKLYPKLLYMVGRIWGEKLYSVLGFAIPGQMPKEYSEVLDGVSIKHILIKKIIPHKRFSKKQISSALESIIATIEENGVPDCFAGHWDNPQLELLIQLKQRYKRPISLVFHDVDFTAIKKRYGSRSEELLRTIDLIGFRNIAAKANFEKTFTLSLDSFLALSGISQVFIDSGDRNKRVFNDVSTFVYVGALIKRKYPISVLNALHNAYGESSFSLTYIGEGAERAEIEKYFHEYNCHGELYLLGRIPRNEIINYLEKSDVFVMISKGEVFGLVYIEAMSLGCITIASRNEGVDGIIQDGINGFLCEAGNEKELEAIINKIRHMTASQLMEISNNAKKTALEFTDKKMAEKYINNLDRMINRFDA